MTPASSMAVWAFSRLFQKVSSAISEFSSVKRFCKVATSKKPPQMREFLGGGRQLRGDHFEHGKKGKGAGSQKPEGFFATDEHRFSQMEKRELSVFHLCPSVATTRLRVRCKTI